MRVPKIVYSFFCKQQQKEKFPWQLRKGNSFLLPISLSQDHRTHTWGSRSTADRSINQRLSSTTSTLDGTRFFRWPSRTYPSRSVSMFSTTTSGRRTIPWAMPRSTWWTSKLMSECSSYYELASMFSFRLNVSLFKCVWNTLKLNKSMNIHTCFLNFCILWGFIHIQLLQTFYNFFFFAAFTTFSS